MWNYVGIVRTTRRLKRARNRLRLVHEEIRDLPEGVYGISNPVSIDLAKRKLKTGVYRISSNINDAKVHSQFIVF